uniref:Uncharacterized protein n=1 Tax=Rhizophora mucronata TaxID=61149 RepID=A0A2P2P6J0_RHIMU
MIWNTTELELCDHVFWDKENETLTECILVNKITVSILNGNSFFMKDQGFLTRSCSPCYFFICVINNLDLKAERFSVLGYISSIYIFTGIHKSQSQSLCFYLQSLPFFLI